MRGREAEHKAVVRLLENPQQSRAKVLLVEGGPSTGKSLLLAVAAQEAEGHRFALVTAGADELSRSTPLAPLRSAAHTIMAAAPPNSVSHPWAASAPQAGMVPSWLAELAATGPVLVTVDDVQWADLATLQTFRFLPGLLAAYPLCWIFAKGISAGAGPAELLFDLLEGDGASRVSLGPVDHEAQVAIISDVLGAVPDAKLIELAAGASGNPGILAEAFGGLLDENAITMCDRQASLASALVSQRIQTMARDRLNGLSARARQLLETASIMEGSFRLEDVAEMLGESPGALLAALEEAQSAQFLVTTPDGLAFQQEFVGQAVAQTVQAPVQRALHWQFGQMLLARGGSPASGGHHLLSGARLGDAVALAGLDRAVAELLPCAPEEAADLAAGALAFTPWPDPERAARTVTTVKALTAAGQWDEAETLVRSALAVPLPEPDDAASRCALSSLLGLTGRSTEAMVEAQNVLANFEITADLRDDATIALLRARMGLRGNQHVDQLARAILAEPSTKRRDVVVAAMVALAPVTWDAGRPTEALDLATQAVRKVPEGPYEVPLFNPYLLLASRLIDVRRIDEATAIMNSIESSEASGTSPWPEGIAEVLRAQLALAAGRLGDAAAQAESVLRPNAPGSHAYEAFALPILATVAVRRGDLRAADEYAGRLSAHGSSGSGCLAHWAHLVAAQVLEARRGPQAALDCLADVLAELPEHCSLLIADPANAPWLVRVALAAKDRKQAANVASAISETSQANPTFTSIRAAAEHAEGLLASDISRLQNAAAQHLDPWARSNALEDCGVLLATAGRRSEAVQSLGEALEQYSTFGAERAMARTRWRLRQLGVRHRHWAAGRRAGRGWEGLTDTERATARLVAQGLTNQQVASQLFISTHTVAFHLRQVFRKLNIRSRVALARIALEHARAEE